jgi:hypothetical protein
LLFDLTCEVDVSKVESFLHASRVEPKTEGRVVSHTRPVETIDDIATQREDIFLLR